MRCTKLSEACWPRATMLCLCTQMQQFLKLKDIESPVTALFLFISYLFLFSVYSNLQERNSGQHEVIARGCIDVADYISETRKTYELAVTLTPAKKNVFSALIEFSFTSVMIQDGIQLPQ